MLTYRTRSLDVGAEPYTGTRLLGMCASSTCLSRDVPHLHRLDGSTQLVNPGDWVAFYSKVGVKLTYSAAEAQALFRVTPAAIKSSLAPGDPADGQGFIPGLVSETERERLMAAGVTVFPIVEAEEVDHALRKPKLTPEERAQLEASHARLLDMFGHHNLAAVVPGRSPAVMQTANGREVSTANLEHGAVDPADPEGK